jgi:hypothetical protein
MKKGGKIRTLVFLVKKWWANFCREEGVAKELLGN